MEQSFASASKPPAQCSGLTLTSPESGAGITDCTSCAGNLRSLEVTRSLSQGKPGRSGRVGVQMVRGRRAGGLVSRFLLNLLFLQEQ